MNLDDLAEMMQIGYVSFEVAQPPWNSPRCFIQRLRTREEKDGWYRLTLPRGEGKNYREAARDYVSKIAGKEIFKDDGTPTRMKVPASLSEECNFLQEHATTASSVDQ